MGRQGQDANSILAEMRHTHCDCVIEVFQGDDETGMTGAAPSTIIAHRAILARASYFSALFEHNDPTCTVDRDDQGRRIARSVYTVRLPPTIDASAVRSTVECLYRGRGSGHRDEQDVDPVERINAILFLGAPAHSIPNLIRNTVHALMCDISRAKDAADQRDAVEQGSRPGAAGACNPTVAAHDDEIEARLRLAWFVRRLADSDLPSSAKANVLAYALHALPDSERDQIVGCHPQLAATIRPYRPEARVGDAHVDAEGQSWRTLHLAFGYCGLAPASASAIVWQGLEFMVVPFFTEDDDGDVLKINVQCHPHGETLDEACASDGEPRGLIHAEPRAARFSARTYCPVDGMRTETFNMACEQFRCGQQRKMPRGAVQVPHVLTKGWASYSKLRRLCSSHYIYDVRHEGSKRHDLLACEIDILVQEL
ncbi:BTB incomplete domain containing protein [Pandoravirus neocaledonia]|uniref:BTB incomplete domain containing protein n=1 Tax=Pandoravirus neocaledonia TaxID=2107708 RepID=A0A2U7UDG1_9VIRU|nr:BTB incomplete domain containing protein [Pandoravirus neocaledonia]AVK76501.1 BTB incomplete domain containing protein [Pandoravirus neocaledonia]